jgi:hypothetical protein
MTMQTLISPEVVLDVQDICDVHDPNNSDVRSVHDRLDDCNIRESMMALKAPFSITATLVCWIQLFRRGRRIREHIFSKRVILTWSSNSDPVKKTLTLKTGTVPVVHGASV